MLKSITFPVWKHRNKKLAILSAVFHCIVAWYSWCLKTSVPLMKTFTVIFKVYVLTKFVLIFRCGIFIATVKFHGVFFSTIAACGKCTKLKITSHKYSSNMSETWSRCRVYSTPKFFKASLLLVDGPGTQVLAWMASQGLREESITKFHEK